MNIWQSVAMRAWFRLTVVEDDGRNLELTSDKNDLKEALSTIADGKQSACSQDANRSLHTTARGSSRPQANGTWSLEIKVFFPRVPYRNRLPPVVPGLRMESRSG
jgi:hypothetical protein